MIPHLLRWPRGYEAPGGQDTLAIECSVHLMISKGMDEVGETCSMIDRDEKIGTKYWSPTSRVPCFLLHLLDVSDNTETSRYRWEDDIKMDLTGTIQSSDGLAVNTAMNFQFSSWDCKIFERKGSLLSEYPVGHVRHTWSRGNGTTLAPEVR